MKKSTTINGSKLRASLLDSAEISQKDVAIHINRDLSQTSRFLAGERACPEKIKKDIYRLYKSKDRQTPVSYSNFWSELVEISIGNYCP